MQEAAAIAQRIVEIRSIPLIIQDNTLAISSSIGVAFYPDDGEDSRTLLKNADTAMYRAKNTGRNHVECEKPERELASVS